MISLIDSVYMDEYNIKVIFDYIRYGKYERDSIFYFVKCLAAMFCFGMWAIIYVCFFQMF